MSWQAFVDTSLVGSGHLNEALIAGHNKQVWASSNSKLLTSDDLQVLLDGFLNPAKLFTDGFVIKGHKFVTIKADDRSIYGRRADNNGGVICRKTSQTLIVGFYTKEMNMELASVAIEQLGDNLIEANFVSF